VTGKVVNNLVHINRIKPYFYRDETPEDPEVMNRKDVEMKTTEPNAQQAVDKEVLVHTVEKKEGTKRRPGRSIRNTEPTAMVPADIDDVIESPADGVAGETAKYESATVTTATEVAEGELETPTPDYDTMYAAECILKQRSREGGRKEFLVRWMEPDAEDTWAKEDDLSDHLLLHWWSTHTKKGTLRKVNREVQVSLINAPGSRAYRRTWPESSKDNGRIGSESSDEYTEEIDQYGDDELSMMLL